MKKALRLCAVVAVLACAAWSRPAVAGAALCDNTRCDLFCKESGYASGRCVWGACRCFS